MKRFLLTIFGFLSLTMSALADILPGAYTIQPYTAQDKYVCGDANYKSGSVGDAYTAFTGTPSVDGLGVWMVEKLDNMYTIRPYGVDRWLNAWVPEDVTEGDVHPSTTRSYCKWYITPVDGEDNTYVIKWNMKNAYLQYNSEYTRLRHSIHANEEDVQTDNYFILTPVNHYTAKVLGSVTTASNATFKWTPGSKSADASLARQKVAPIIGNISTTTAKIDGGAIFTTTVSGVDEFSTTGITLGSGVEDGDLVKTLAADDNTAGGNVVTFAYPYVYTVVGYGEGKIGSVTYNGVSYSDGKTIKSPVGVQIIENNLTQDKIANYNATGITIDQSDMTITLRYAEHNTLPTGWTEDAPKFYRLINKASQKYASYVVSGGTTHIKQVASADVAAEGVNAIWYFKANEESTTYRIYNLVDQSKQLYGPDRGLEATGSDYYLIDETLKYSGFAISKTSDGISDAWNNKDGAGEWVSNYSVDGNGSCWDYEEVPVSEAWTLWLAANNTEGSNYDVLAGSVFGPTTTQVSTYKASINSIFTTTTYDTDKTWTVNTTVVTDAVAAAKKTVTTGWNTTFPNEGGKFILRNYDGNRGYFLTEITGNTFTSTAESTDDDKFQANNVWEFIPDGTLGDGLTVKYKMRNRGTGTFLTIGSNNGDASSYYSSINRSSAVDFCISSINATGNAVIYRSDRNGASTSGAIALTSAKAVVNGSTTYTEADSKAAQWILYPEYSDIPAAGHNYQIRNLRDNDQYIGYSTTDSRNMIHQTKANNGANGVWTLAAGSTTGTFKMYPASDDTKKVVDVTNGTWTMDETGVDIHFIDHPYNGGYFMIYHKDSGSQHYAWDCATSNKMGTWLWYSSTDYKGTSWNFESLDRDLEDAQLALKARLDGISSENVKESTAENSAFFLNKTKFDSYVAMETKSDYTTANEYELYSTVVAKTNGFADTDFNIPANGTYAFVNKKYPAFYVMPVSIDGAEQLTRSHEYTGDMFFNLTFTTGDDDKVTVTVQSAKDNTMYAQAVTKNAVATLGTTEAALDIIAAPHDQFGYFVIGANNYTDYTAYNMGDAKIMGWQAASGQTATMWQVKPIADYKQALLDKVTAAEGDALFQIPDAQVTASGLTDKVDAFTSDPNYTNYAAIETVLDNSEYRNMPANGRYLIKNHYTGKYLTSYTSLVNTTTPSYYSIWDLTKNDDGTYTFRNEGSAYLMEPGKDERTTGLPYLMYDEALASTSAHTYSMGGSLTDQTQNTNIAKIKFESLGNGYAYMRDSRDPYRATIALLNDACSQTNGYNTGHMNGQEYDETMQSYISGNTNMEWTLETFDAGENTTDADGKVTRYGEAGIFYYMIYTNKVGYVGGPVTMANVSAVPCLNNLNTWINACKAEIAAIGSPSSFGDNDANCKRGAGYQRDFTLYVNNQGRSLQETDGTFTMIDTPAQATEGVTTMDTQFTLALSEGKTFYFENISRPSYKAHLIDNGGTPQSNASLAITDTKTQWTLEGATDGFYIKNVATGNYIASRTNGAKDMAMVSDKDKAAIIDVDEVVPGVYLIYDKRCDLSEDETVKAEKYMTIGGSSNNYRLTYYSLTELSTMWKIYSQIGIAVTPKAREDLASTTMTGWTDATMTTSQEVSAPKIASFGSVLDCEVSSVIADNQLLSPYYAEPAITKKTTDGKTTYQITLTQIPSVSGIRYLRANNGYIMRSTDTKPETLKLSDGKTESHYGDLSDTQRGSKTAADFANYSKGTNAMYASDGSLTVTADNYQYIYVLSYYKTTTQVGTYNGQPVYGVGTGFYHVKAGVTIPKGIAILDATKFTGDAPEIHGARALVDSDNDGSTVGGATLRFVDESGMTTDIHVPFVKEDTNFDDNKIYDLNGRLVETPVSGQIYIMNGKKVLF